MSIDVSKIFYVYSSAHRLTKKVVSSTSHNSEDNTSTASLFDKKLKLAVSDSDSKENEFMLIWPGWRLPLSAGQFLWYCSNCFSIALSLWKLNAATSYPCVPCILGVITGKYLDKKARNACNDSPIFLDLSKETTIRMFLWENSKGQQINQQYHIDKMPEIYVCPD